MQSNKCFITWYAFAFKSLCNDSRWLMFGLAKGFAKFLHTVSINNDSMPAKNTNRSTVSKGFYHVTLFGS